jgi:hypothetical protein
MVPVQVTAIVAGDADAAPAAMFTTNTCVAVPAALTTTAAGLPNVRPV